MKHSRVVASFLAIAGFVFVSGRAQAGTFESGVWPGSNCVKYTSGGTVVYNYSRIGNSSTTSSMGIDCPLEDPEHRMNTAFVIGFDVSSSAISCNVINVSWSGGTPGAWWFNSFAFHPSTGNTNVAQAIFPDPFTIDKSHGVGYHQYISCSIPAATSSGNISYIQAYGSQLTVAP